MLVKRSLPMTLRRGAMAPFQTLREEMDRLFNDWVAEVDEGELGFAAETFVPRLDVVENADGLNVTAELPGLEMADLEVSLAPRLLTISGRKSKVTEKKEESYYRRERHFGSFSRDVALPWEVDPNEIQPVATFKNGVLTVSVPKPAGVPGGQRRIEITTA
ncbi:MAG TPA: Hsp20/alpha crystallin family protein [Thermoanaerobaculia bacterium]